MEMKCPVCGAPMENGKCGYCGRTEKTAIRRTEEINSASHQSESITEPQNATNNFTSNKMNIIPGVSKKSKTVALLLCIFLGGLGVHRFYVGKVGMGILYLFTVGLFGIGWIVDIILIATGSFRDGFDLPLRQ